ncbi:hypothetical protein RHSIM_Rhsim06G0077400 [Rhododendron simsii]|uniref:No apical meristem-associated C-terminal domain-containing protein n=1 Tax=Rhododendron simsii TaxID=118357 RepID=A0A834GVP2_RHOSS|nr:hypothetical protein RHSIM_Rhsim06G0077400 [Rhododendron simsii]
MKKGDQSEGVNFIFSKFSNMRKEQKELVQQEIFMAAEREQMKIQAKLEQERMKIATKREQDQINFEREIMLKDPSKVTTEEGRAWVIAQQKAIWASVNRGGGIGDGSSGNV